MSDISALTHLTETEQMSRLSDFFTFASPEILKFSAFVFLTGFAICIVAILITFGIFKAYSIFQSMISV
mgnify:CR=1 FL=1